MYWGRGREGDRVGEQSGGSGGGCGRLHLCSLRRQAPSDLCSDLCSDLRCRAVRATMASFSSRITLKQKNARCGKSGL